MILTSSFYKQDLKISMKKKKVIDKLKKRPLESKKVPRVLMRLILKPTIAQMKVLILPQTKMVNACIMMSFLPTMLMKINGSMLTLLVMGS